jgi:hypothetical protein
MSRLPDINLIRLFDFYLLMMFVIGLLRRAGFYKDVTLVSVAAVLRQPNLVRRLGANRDVLMNWSTLRPVFFAVLLLAIQFVLSRLIWPDANLTGRDVSHSWWRAALLVALFLPMAAVDTYFLFRVGQIDRGIAHQYLARAEYWLTGWRGPAVRVVTFGYVNPRKMVDDQVRDSLRWFRGTMAWSMWWVTVQVSLRVLFGLVIWLLWAWSIRSETV